jgi:integrase
MPVRTFTDKRGRKRYSVEFEQRGNRVFRRLPAGATKEQAAQLETRLKHELIDQAVLGKRPNVTLKAAIGSWLAHEVAGKKAARATGSHASQVIRALEGHESVAEVARVAERIRKMDTLAPATRNRRLCVLKATAKYAHRQGWAGENYSSRVALLPEAPYRRREVTPAQARRLIQHATSPRDKALIALSAYTGLRLGEVLRLTPKDVRGGVIVAKDTKNGTDRIIPILPELEPHLSQLPFRAGWRNVYRGFLRARQRAGLDLRYHDLRHMVGTALANTQADPRLSMKLMGHKSVVSHQRYVHPDVEVMRRMLGKAVGTPITVPIKKKKKAAKAA